mmetsp:Transcript_27721/g.40926  ORF Transcript_27721/g.40926 Transcript_27721/m.40926 type:complete len:496 (-) Transcript_27721:332-1819(-)|eukprot:CAMPEP_0194214010 /NCGR_PEP_ID=MMETSP0156-20130528/14994_1 /TAXON_ID=33649 /ORGANISM="Thalassionema nitzschioides, Strain L26-B" /LENGTH=495 /DNA_ID=CAMNT_0038942177 /DNA_START=17 /DNA_END=1504 /DNA_ORIENTATION=+
MSGGGHFHAGDKTNAVVVDIGSYASKLGFAGEDFPKSYFRSNTAILKKDGNFSIKYDYYTRPLENDNDYIVANPVDDVTGLWYGETAMWYKLIEEYIQHGYESSLKTKTEHHPMLLIERSYNPPAIRQQVLELLMEDLQVPAAFLARDATMACYACGRTTGTVVDIGHSGTTVTPVFDGYVETKGIRRLPIGTRSMDELIVKDLDALHGKPFLPIYQVQKHSKRQDPIHYLARLQVAQQCREESAGAAVLQVSDAGFTAPGMNYELPDGTVIDIPSKKRFGVANAILGQQEEAVSIRDEALSNLQGRFKERIVEANVEFTEEEAEDKQYYEEVFSKASSVGLLKRQQSERKYKGRKGINNTWKYLKKACASALEEQQDYLTASAIPSMVCDSAFRCDREQQPSLMGNVVVTGGGACLGPTDQSLSDFVRDQVESIIHQHTPGWRVKVLSPNFQERSICSWLGGSILGSLGTFHDMWITKKEYEEWGPAIVNRKCP